MDKFKFSLMLILTLLISSIALAQIPRTLSYQGILTDNAGKPRPDGDYQFTFCLYDTATGGAPMWTEQKTLPVKNGLFSTILGDATPFGAAVKFDKPYWLGIRGGNEPELSPRIPLTSVGYSMNAVRADTANISVASMADTTWNHNGANIYRLYGNIGIGKQNPNASIDLLTANDIDATIGMQSGISTKWWISADYERNRMLIGGNGSTKPPNYNFPVAIDYRGNIGIGTLNPEGKIDIRTIDNSDVNISMQPGISTRWWISGDYSANRLLVGGNGSSRPTDEGFPIAIHNNGNVGIGTLNPNTKLDVAGRTKTQVLEITGGSDLAEPFEISHVDSLPVGSLVVIDPEQPGKLKQATEPYDKRVAGVISGAGGINPGLTLTQEGKLTDSQHVALTGKVYALATAANGAIEPGDLLTTSSIPGHAMKATDHERAFGSVIGKAMSGLKEDKGLVLVLVNLQ